MIKESLALRVLIVSFLLVGLPLLVASFVLFERAYQSDMEAIKTNLKEAGSYRAITLEKAQPFSNALLNEITLFLDVDAIFKGENKEDLSNKLKKIASFSPGVGIFIVDNGKEGQFNLIATNFDKVTPPFLSYSTFENLICDEGKISTTPFFSFIDGEKMALPLFSRVVPMESKERKEVLGYLIVSASLQDKVALTLEPTEEFGQVMHFSLLQESGKVFAASDPQLKEQFIKPFISKQSTDGNKHFIPVLQKEGDSFFEFIWGNKVEIGYLYPFPEKGFYLLSYSSKDDLFASSIRHFFIVYTALGFIIVLGAAVTYKLTELMSKPFKQLMRLIDQVRKGNLKDRFVEEKLGFEINILGQVFNETMSSLMVNMQKERDNRILKETYQSELEIGQNVQKQLLPQELPEVKGVELFASYLPSDEVGGDFYDCNLKGERLSLLVADAAGRGISSCLYALGLRSQIRSYQMLHDDVGLILSKANNIFVKDTGESGMFVTVFMGSFDLEKKIFSYFSSGHVPAILRKKDGTLRMLSHRGMALGLMESDPYLTEEVVIESGDLLLLYTDGLVEVINEKNQYFGESRLKNLLHQRRWFTAREVVEGLTEEINLFRGKAKQDEEITLLVMRVVDV